MLVASYLFEMDGNRIILNDERSGIGYGYPRIFIESAKTGNHANFDVSLRKIFGQTKAEFESWLDGTEVIGADIEAVCNDIGINYKVMLNVIRDILGTL